MKKLITTQLMILMMLGFSTSLVAQKSSSNPPAGGSKSWSQYIFPFDSISGFDENAAKQDALNRKCFGQEFYNLSLIHI